jgi:predicted DNA-binding protein YlxM (UPF0122 family)
VLLDTLTSREHQVALFELYGALLTEHQRDVLRLYLTEDWSLSEIAGHQATSRAAVHDLIRRAAHSLEEYERRLGLLAQQRRRQEQVAAVAAELADLRRRVGRIEHALGRL